MSDGRPDSLDELLDEAARALVDRPVPPDLRQLVRARIDGGEGPVPHGRAWRIAYATVAAAACLLAIGLLGRGHDPEPEVRPIAQSTPATTRPAAIAPVAAASEPDRPRPAIARPMDVPRRPSSSSFASQVEDLRVEPLALPDDAAAPIEVASLPHQAELDIPPLSVPPAGAEPTTPFEEEH